MNDNNIMNRNVSNDTRLSKDDRKSKRNAFWGFVSFLNEQSVKKILRAETVAILRGENSQLSAI